jgi:ubiquinone biosynthesis monooxygenase Coq7
MTKNLRYYSLLDQTIANFDRALRTITGNCVTTNRPNPAQSTVLGMPEVSLTEQQRKHSAALMRIDHTGEVCAQALYQAQAIFAHTEKVRTTMQQAAQEENDHLVWCHQRLKELNSHTSYLNPFWYLGSFMIGAVASAISDKYSLGFVAETEHQVVRHLEKHLVELPTTDEKSRKILLQMRDDEKQHATLAIQTGAAELPATIQQAMRVLSKIMTTTAYWV